MKISVTRRDVLRFGAGGAVGAMLTPAPWKAIDDLAIWTQNWSWIPRPPKGPSTMRATVCALCPAGCAATARCIGGLPVSMRAASPNAPLCPLGLTGHHLPYHPARMTRPVRVFRDGRRIHRVPVPADGIILSAAHAIVDAKMRSRTVAVLDMRPGRSVSWAWQRLLGSIPGAVYVPAPGREGSGMTTLQRMVGSGDFLGIDIERARTILSFRAPLAEGWGSLGRAIGSGARLIQIDPVRTRTAERADRWIPAKPGTEALLATAIAQELLRRDATMLPVASSAEVAAVTGVSQADIAAIAGELAGNGPALVVAEEGLGTEAEEAIQSINLILKNSAIVARAELPAPYSDEVLAPVQELEQVDDGSISLLFIDTSAGDVRFPWSLVERKLAPNAMAVALSPFFTGTARNANYIVPTLPYLETASELPTPFDAPAAEIAISAPLLPPQHQAFDPAAFIRAVADSSQTELPGKWSSSEELMRARVAAIHASGEGAIRAANGELTPLKDLGSSDELWDALVAGGRWQGNRAAGSIKPGRGVRSPVFSSRPETNSAGLTLVLRVPRDVTASGAVSPVMTKLYQESGLRRAADTAVVNPVTARQLGVAAGSTARLHTGRGSIPVTIAADHAVMPGVVEMTIAPDAMALGDINSGEDRSVLDIVKLDASGSWRSVASRLVREA